MKFSLLVCTLSLGICCSTVWAQKNHAKKPGTFSFSMSLSDYNFLKRAKDSSFGYAFKQKDLFKPGHTTIGVQLSYWKGLLPHIDISANLGGDFSNFPALFVKGDSIGQAKFSAHFDALVHFMFFRENSAVNPFLTGGFGAGYFGKQPAVYAPVGAGIQFRFKEGALLMVQSQWRMALSQGITNDYMYYSIGMAKGGIFDKTDKKQKSHVAKQKPAKKTSGPAKNNVKKESMPADPDSDGDGLRDSKDMCPNEKGTALGCPDTDGDGIADKDDKCKDVAGLLRYQGCPVPDTDGDGINDEMDKCKTLAGPKQNNGCPWPDADGDGVSDKDDKCPDVKGSADNNGCPFPTVAGAEILNMSADSVTYCINFDFDRSILLPDAFIVLRSIVDILKTDNDLKLNITGHADNLGTDASNIRVSSERAGIARDYFLSYQIAASRISSAYYGASRPLDKVQQWRNRRVELTLHKK